MKSASPTRLSVEQLEDRTLLTFGIPWYNPSSLTLSFVPDGTDVSGTPSSLNALLGSNTAVWEREVLRAFQTWAIQTNVNVGIVPDDGLPLGTPGLSQGDSRFGDIRIAARPLGTDSLADTVGFDPSGGTWSGDVVFNSLDKFGIGDTPTQSDLFSVALHEAGHSLGLGDNDQDPTSAMWGTYSPRTGLDSNDVAAIQAMYGVRPNDVFEGFSGDNTTATAFNLTRIGNLTAISADITQVGDTDVYRFTTPSASTGITGLTVNLQAAGISLLTARVTILDSLGNTLATTVTTDPLNNNLSIALPNYSPSTSYYVKVQGAGTDVFSAGAYNLRLNYSPTSYGNSFLPGASYVNVETGSNNTQATANVLGFNNLSHATAFTVVGSLNNPTDTDWYRITPLSLTSFTGTLTVGLVPQDTSGVRTLVAVFNGQGQQLPTVVVTNENGAFTVQLANQSPGTTYFLRVTAADPTGTHAVGSYALTSYLSPVAVTTFNLLDTNTLSGSQNTLYSQMTVDEGQLTQFSLSASTSTSGPDAAVRMTVIDNVGNVVFTMAVLAGRPLATGTVWLNAGTYSVVLNAATRDGSYLPSLAFSLSSRERSDPIDPYPIDPTDPTSPPPPPPDGQPIVVSPPVTTPPPALIVGSIIDPFLGL